VDDYWGRLREKNQRLIWKKHAVLKANCYYDNKRDLLFKAGKKTKSFRGKKGPTEIRIQARTKRNQAQNV